MNDQEREGAFEPRRASIVTPRSQAIVPTPSLHRGFCDTSGSASSSRSTARLTAQSLWKKRRYFVRLGLAVREALRLHKRADLWERREGRREWRNVSEHCLVEQARAAVLAEWLRLPADTKRRLALAAAAHDFFKRREQETVSGRTWADLQGAIDAAARWMRDAGFEEKTIRLVNSVGHSSLAATEARLRQPRLSDEDVASLILHYVDDYTIDSAWAAPAEARGGGGRANDLDRRVERNEANPRYAALDAEGRIHFEGETTFEAQRRIGHAVEERLAALLVKAGRSPFDPVDLPMLVDDEIRALIAADGAPASPSS